MKNFYKYLMATLALVLFFGTFVFLYMKSRPEKVEYEQVTAEMTDIKKKTILTGKIEPRNEVKIKPQINGIIAELYKEAGEYVSENEVIAKLKVIPDMSSLSSAQSRLRMAEINLKQANTNFEREKKLFAKKLVSSEEYDKVKQALDQAKEEKIAATDALEVIRDGVSSSNATSSSILIRSTISGLILDIPVKEGNSVIQANTLNEGTTVATVANMSDIIFDGNIDETEVGSLSEGMPLKITVGALRDLFFNATLEYISPKATENNGTNLFEIKAAVKIPADVKIRSGYSANAEIVLEEASNVVSVPERIVEFNGDSTFVYKSIGKEYERVAIKTGISDGINIEVKEGISQGDMLRGAKKLNKKGSKK